LPFEQPEAFEAMKDYHVARLGWTKRDLDSLLFTDQLGSAPLPVVPRLRLTGGLFDDPF
jgi:hypothetical protein